MWNYRKYSSKKKEFSTGLYSFFKRHIQYLGHLVSEQVSNYFQRSWSRYVAYQHQGQPKKWSGSSGWLAITGSSFQDLQTSSGLWWSSQGTMLHLNGTSNVRRHLTIYVNSWWSTQSYVTKIRCKVTFCTQMQAELVGQEYSCKNTQMEKKNQKITLFVMWPVLWKSTQLGSLDEGSLCYLYVHKKTELLRDRCRCYHQKLSLATEEIFKLRNHELKGQQLGCGAGAI